MWLDRICVMWCVGWLSVIWVVQIQMVWGHCCGLPTWERNIGINSKSLRVFFSAPWGQGPCLNCENLECFLSLTWHPGSIRRAPVSASCIPLSHIWLLAEKTQAPDQKGSIRYSSRSLSLDIHGMRLRSKMWSTLIPLHNSTRMPKFLPMCIYIVIKILMGLSYCHCNLGKSLARHSVPQNRDVLNTGISSQHLYLLGPQEKAWGRCVHPSPIWRAS